MITPVIGERYRDTARELSNVVHFDRFRATLARDAEREEILMRILIHKSKRLDATVGEIQQARTAGVEQLKQNRSIAHAIRIAEQHLPPPQRQATP